MITSVDAATATIRHRSGIARIDLSLLPGELRTKIAPAYDPQKARVLLASETRAAEQIAQASANAEAANVARKELDASAQFLSVKVLSHIPEGGLLAVQGDDKVIMVRDLANEGSRAVGDVAGVKVVPDGLYRYTTALGAAATVHAYKAISEAK